MQPAYNAQAPKKAPTLSINADLPAKARALDINLSVVCLLLLTGMARAPLKQLKLAAEALARRCFTQKNRRHFKPPMLRPDTENSGAFAGEAKTQGCNTQQCK